MEQYDAPLTCTSANVSGMQTEETSEKILAQFGERASMIDIVIDDGLRGGVPSTVVRIIDEKIEILRDGPVVTSDVMKL